MKYITLPTWRTTDNTFYYNFIKNKNKGPAKRKVTFGQTLTTQSLNILNRQEKSGSRYQTRSHARSNNSPEESPDDDDDDDNDDDDDDNNSPSNHQPNQPSPPPPPPPQNQNMNNRNGGGNNPPDGG